MASDDESGASNVVSELETQFVPRSDDDEVLWEVQEITAERGRKYKVKWVGTDPATGKPWAQSWVAKHDCTDDLVHEWRAKRKRLAERRKKKRGGQTSTASRTSGSSKRAGSSTSGKGTRPPTSDATTSRMNSVRERRSPPPKGSTTTTKRKRQTETPATTTTSGGGQADEQGEQSRPHKKQRMALEVLVPPLSSSSEDEDAPPALGSRVQVLIQKNKAPLKGRGAVVASDGSGGEDSPPPKVKGKSVRRSGVHSKSATASGSREESRRRDLKTKTGDERRRERVVDTTLLSGAPAQGEESLRLKSKKKSTSKRISSPERNDDLSEKEVVPPGTPVKIGPPRGVKPQEVSRPRTGPTPPPTKLHEDESADERVPAEEFEEQLGDDFPAFGEPLLLLQDMADDPPPASPSPRVSIPEVTLSKPLRSPDLSPGARARLDLFDLMMADASEPDLAPPADVPEHASDDTHINHGAHDTHDVFDTSDPPHLTSPLPTKPGSKHLKPATPNGLVVPETESPGTSQSQPHASPALPLSLQPPPPARESPRRPMELPTITVITASATSSPASPQDLLPPPQRLQPLTKRPSKRPAVKPIPQISPDTFRSYVVDSEAPPSSIESFASPRRVQKGKQKAVEGDQLQSSLSEGEGDGERRERSAQKKVTDSELRRRGKELFDQVQLARGAERQNKKKVKRLKTIDEVVHRAVPPSSKGLPLPFTSGADSALEIPLEELVDLTGGANSTTLDTAEHSEAKPPPSEEERARMRIELRQEEEESTQEAMGICPLPPTEEPKVMDDRDAQMLTPGSSEPFPINGRPEDADHSADIQLASVVARPSQGQSLEDTDIDPLPATQPTSSPPHLIPENLTDSPKRRLGEALSLLNVKSEEIQRLQRELADERESAQRLKTEIAEVKPPSEPTGPVLAAWEAERAQWARERSKWENDFAAWETQRLEWCDDRASLLARVTELLDAAARTEEVKVKLSELEAERAAWAKERDGMRNDMTRQSEELGVLTNARKESDEDRSKWEAERAAWADEKARWEIERAEVQEKQGAASRSVEELTASVQSLTSAKVSAEKDRDFFREQYMQASAFVSSVRDENVELEKRVKIAEGQAQEGVAAIKAFHEGRIRTLQAEVDRWKGLTELLQEKDRRTNDELRLRAAQATELGDLCGRLAAEKKSLEALVGKLGRAQYRSVVQRNKLYREIIALKKKRSLLRSKLSRLTKMANGSTQDTVPPVPAPAPPILEDPELLDPNDMVILPEPTPLSSDISLDEPMLFPCLWRPQWRDQCQHTFDTKEDLERHVQEHFRDLMDGEE